MGGGGKKKHSAAGLGGGAGLGAGIAPSAAPDASAVAGGSFTPDLAGYQALSQAVSKGYGGDYYGPVAPKVAAGAAKWCPPGPRLPWSAWARRKA